MPSNANYRRRSRCSVVSCVTTRSLRAWCSATRQYARRLRCSPVNCSSGPSGCCAECRSLGELTPRTLDRIVSVGEKLALHLLHHALSQRGLSVATLPASELIVTDATFGNAAPLEDAIAERVRQRLLPTFDRADYILTEGFVGATLEGETTTMGKESSTLTAALLARQLNARELVLYTPVPGIFTADPMEVASARRIDHLHYDDAERLARAGLKLLFPTMIGAASCGDEQAPHYRTRCFE